MILALLFFAPGLYGSGREIYADLQFNQITSIQGLSNNTVFSIIQDKEGFIWIATRQGLNRYDGHEITSYYRDGILTIPGNHIPRLCVTESGDLFIGTLQGGAVYEKLTDSFTELLCRQKSLGNVASMIELSSGEVLISSDVGLFLVNREKQIRQLGGYSQFRDLCEFRTGVIWGLYGNEILVMNVEGEIIRRYSNAMGNVAGFDMSSSNVECLFKDSSGKVWLGTKRDGLAYYDYESDEFHSLKLQRGVNPIEDNFVRTISEDANGRLWIGTESGLYIYDASAETFQFYGQNFNLYEKGLNDKAIYSIFRSRDDMMWIGTYFGGVNYTTLRPQGFRRIYADGGHKILGGNAVSEIIETSDKKLWIATEDGGISILDPGTGTFSYLKHTPGDPGSLSSNNVHALEEDHEGNVWIGTFIGGLNRYDAQSGHVERIELSPPVNMEEDVYSKSLFSIHIDSKGRIWVGSIEGLYMKEIEDDQFKIWKPELFNNNFIYHVEEDHSGNIWACSYEQGIYKIDPDMHVLNYRKGTNRDILSDRFIFCYFDSEGFTWFGSEEGGLLKYDPARDHFTSYGVEEGLPSNTVYAIAEDLEGKLWLSTGRGLSMLDPHSEQFVNYTGNDGLVSNQFNFRSGLLTSSGIIYFGAVNGLTYFDPGKLEKPDTRPVIHFVDFKLSNESLEVGKEDILTTHIDFQEEITLRYRHKVFTFDFVALNYYAPGNTEYAFFLEGLEEGWNYVGNQRSATYTNLSPGKYIFHLKASAGGGVWTGEERTVSLHMKPPFWLSVWGYILYGFLIVSVTLMSVRFYMVRQRELMNISLAKMEKEKNEEISKHRINFFTYISHEFKTPLTLIIATLEHVMSDENLLPAMKDYGTLMKKNATRLLVLISQLMDFRKIETDHVRLKFNRGDVVAFIQSTFESFNPLMEKRSVEGTFTTNRDSYITFFDADKFEKILTNLLSNACKSFEKQGKIDVDVRISERSHLASPESEKTGSIIITVTDNGQGLTAENRKHIFEPFVSSDSREFPGSGIGLSLVHSLVKYLGGKIVMTSPRAGGTRAVVQLPLVHNPDPGLIQDDRFIEKNTSFTPDDVLPDYKSEPFVEFDVQDHASVTKYELLIVEDNMELASFLKHHFSGVFKVIIAGNGEEALKRIKKAQPDLIISDIMMPHMDGFRLCNAVKNSIETSHIPMILLTSKVDAESRVDGLLLGADAYISKPFNLKELDLQVRNILRSRENLRKHLSGTDSFSETTDSLGNRDQVFIKQLSDTVFRHLDDGRFGVDQFCKEMNVSRTHLHMKLKKMTGLTSSEFIRNIRLKEANKLLLKGEFSVSEIAYRVGFNDPAYFSRAFKKLFNKNPSEVNSSSVQG
ncbi:MAG: two-component regulator propeller domain-containing protein [Bacteroidota bacterium]